MATNKKKDAASLFELLDKSTLKVPKGGALKIPSWYSSKTNPPTQAAPGSTGVHVGGATSAPPANQVQPQPKPAPVPVPLPQPQMKPAAPASAVPFGVAYPGRPAMTPIPPQKGIFAPVAPSAPHGNRNVIWLSAACALVAVILLIVIISKMGSGTNHPTPPTNPGTTNNTVPPPGTAVGGTTLTPGGDTHNNNTLPPPNNSTTHNNVVIPPPPVKGTRGTIQDANEIQWNQEPKGLYYIAIISYSTNRADYAHKIADFLADNGVNVVLLTNTEKQIIRVFMREGFPESAKSEMEVAMARIRKIGELHPDFKKTGVSVFAPSPATLNRK